MNSSTWRPSFISAPSFPPCPKQLEIYHCVLILRSVLWATNTGWMISIRATTTARAWVSPKSHLYSTEKMNEWGSSYVRGVGALGCSGGCRCRTTTKRSQEWEENLKYVSHNFRKYLQPSKHLFPSVGAVQSLSRVWLFATPWTSACQASLSFTVSQSMLKFMFIESVMPSSHLILRHPFLLLPFIFLGIRVFSNESALHIRWPKDWSFSISSSNEYSGLISFRIDWFDQLDLFPIKW